MSITLTYFKNLFTTSYAGNDERVLELVEYRVTDRMNAALLKLFMNKEI